jgi:hypothetical protein
MYTTIRVYAQAPSAEVLHAHEAGIKEAMSVVPGFRSYQLVNTPDGGGLSITETDDESGAQASTEAAAAYVGANMQGAFSAPVITAGEVAIEF